ncbi:MAG: ferritin-like domain-containing protein [Pseudomonadota bacterium]
MEKSVHMGTNRTGIDMSPLQSKAMASGAAAATPTGGSEAELHELDKEYMRDAGGLGSVPLPGTLRGAFKAMKDKLSGQHTEALLNKMGERLAFERSGVRIYEGFIAKCEAAAASGKLPAPVDLDLLRQFCIEEAQHFELLRDVLDGLGADATAQTPDADVAGVASLGLMKVVQDPRTSVTQSLEAMLSIELTDNAGWELLVQLARAMTMDEIGDRFQRAEEQEDRHLATIRQWYEAAVCEEAGLAPARAH